MSDTVSFHIVRHSRMWRVYRDGCEIAVFASREAAEYLVTRSVEEGCRRGTRSRVTVEDGEGREESSCGCQEDEWAAFALQPEGGRRLYH
jgi:hypothetical protein